MDISVVSSSEQLELSLGPCRAELNLSQAQVLRDQLAEVLLSAWNQPKDYWQEQQTKLEGLKYILPALVCVDEKTIKHLLEGCIDCCWISIVRYTRKELPEVAEMLLSTINTLDSKFYCTLEAFIDELHLAPASSIANVADSLEKIIYTLENDFPELSPLLLEQKNLHCKIKPSFNDRATLFLASLSVLPSSNLRLVLKSLSREDLGFLFSAAKMLQLTNLLTQLKEILPEKIFQLLESKCPAKLEETELRGLLSKLNLELKELKNLLSNRNKQ